MRHLFFVLSFVFLFSKSALGKDNLSVIVLSLDGAKPKVLRSASAINKIAAEGSVSWGAQTITPSLTLPSHVSMLTGVPPSQHKILWNDWLKENGVLTIATIFSLAKKENYKTAFFATKEKFKHFEIPGSLDKFSTESFPAEDLVQNFLSYYQSESPDLSFLHIHELDSSGHKFGWESKEQYEALEKVDKAVEALAESLAKAKRDYVLIITADHGGHDKGHGTTSPEDMTIPWIASGSKVKKNHTLRVPISTMDTAATALYLLGIDAPKIWQGKAVRDAFN